MKKSFSLILAIICIASLVGCQFVYDDLVPHNDDAITSRSDPEIAETILYNGNNVVIIAKSIEYKDGVADFSVIVENDSVEMLDADIENVTVNDYMMQSPLGGTINPGTKKIIHMWFYPSVLSACNIEEIADIEFEICFRYSEGREEYFRVPRLRIETTAFNEYEYFFDDSGTVAYEKDGLKIVSKNILSKDFYQYGPSALFYVENSSNDVYYIMFDNVSVNDNMIYPFANVCSILPGKYAIMGLSFDSNNLSTLGFDTVEAIDTIQFCFTILKNELYFSTGDENNTDLITIKIHNVIE